jgi:cellulose 1,4-beta-cellobiosidase
LVLATLTYIGINGGSPWGDNSINGSTRDFRIYGQALTAGQVTNLYALGAEASNAAITAVLTPPAAPIGLTATPGNGQATLSWTASSGASSYNLKRATVSGGSYSTITNVTSTAGTNANLANGTTYFYVVSAVNISGESTNSAQVSVLPTSTTPVNLTMSVSDGTLGISWPSDHTGWRLFMQTNQLANGLSVNTNDWTTIPNSQTTNLINLPLDPTTPAGFYRLVYP